MAQRFLGPKNVWKMKANAILVVIIFILTPKQGVGRHLLFRGASSPFSFIRNLGRKVS
jgi:hypothetical protein